MDILVVSVHLIVVENFGAGVKLRRQGLQKTFATLEEFFIFVSILIVYEEVD